MLDTANGYTVNGVAKYWFERVLQELKALAKKTKPSESTQSVASAKVIDNSASSSSDSGEEVHITVLF